MDDPKEQAAFKAKYGIELKRARDLGRVSEAGGVLHRDTDGDGKIDSTAWSTRACAPTRSPWSGRTISSPMAASITTTTGSRRSTRRSGVKAVEDYKTNIDKYGPVGAASFCFDEAFNVIGPGQGLQLHHLQLLPRRLRRSVELAVVGKVEISRSRSRRKGGSLNGAWGWAIPKSSPNRDAAWTFIKWVESRRRSPRSARCRAARRPAPTCSTIPR